MRETHRHGWFARAVAISAVGLLAACGGDDSTAIPDSSTSSTVPPPDLTQLVLAPTDLNSGDALDAQWEVGDVSEGVDIVLPECVVEEPGDKAIASAEAKLVTVSPLHLPSVEEDLSAFGPDDAAKAFAAAELRLDDCAPQFVYQGEPVDGTIERLPLTLGGDQAAAWRTSVTIGGAAVSITSMHIVSGNLGVALVHVDVGVPDTSVLEGLAATALAKATG